MKVKCSMNQLRSTAKSDFTDDLKYLPNEAQQFNKRRKKTQNKYNLVQPPPYLKNVKNNVGKLLLKSLKKHFPASQILHKICNKNTAKLTYSCMKNINSLFHLIIRTL